ncbi:hypothetical protein AB8A20_08110 [Tardiphaga sp. 604_B6_N1_1]|uniref:hypothetical protein n=1 Tax=unclassified Tardiphaga TaxID=2631404 RepID=UPI003F298974
MPQPLQYETKAFSNISTTPAPFALRGGLYSIPVKAIWGGGMASLQCFAVDTANYVPVLTVRADGVATTLLPSGTYRLVIDAATAVYIEIIAIVGGHADVRSNGTRVQPRRRRGTAAC